MRGKVYLVGAGPGDPKLITVKGLECIREADTIVYDHLASRTLLQEAKKGTEIIYVGKKGMEKGKYHSLKQEEINQLLIEKAREGRIVIRLKGGDPFIFGRGGEEALSLEGAGVPFEVVPGITSAYAAATYAGIPVTSRKISSTVAFITGHEDPTKSRSDIDWEKIATGIGTLIFLMGVKNLPSIVKKLINHGRSKDTPVAFIRWGTTSDQRCMEGTLGTIVEKVKESDLRPPAIMVVGDVVSLREKLRWFEKKPLFGKRILITRAQTQASILSRALEEFGAEPVEFPTIKIVSPKSCEELDKAISQLADTSYPKPYYDWVIFTSANGVNFFFSRLQTKGRDLRILKGIKVAAIGPATARRLEEKSILPDYVPKEYRAEAILEGLKKEGIKGKKILIPRAKVAREILPQQLADGGAMVNVVTVYETQADESRKEEAKRLLEEGKIDIITFTSSSTVKNFVSLLKDIDLKKTLQGVLIACIGPITAETAEKLGLEVGVVAKDYTISGLVGTILQAQT